jgi:hypothetical protein
VAHPETIEAEIDGEIEFRTPLRGEPTDNGTAAQQANGPLTDIEQLWQIREECDGRIQPPPQAPTSRISEQGFALDAVGEPEEALVACRTAVGSQLFENGIPEGAPE